jgi:signal transduction histidine kinase/ActR/RegA family two-component response regulator
MTVSLVNPADPLERQNAKLLKMTEALMRRVEQVTDDSGAAYAHFQRALVLEDQVRARTRDLERTLELLNRSNARLSLAMTEAERARADLYDALEAVREGFALFDSGDRLVMCNSRFCEALPDVAGELAPGLRFVDYIRKAAASRHLVLPGGQRPHQWMRERLRHHRLPSASFNVQTDGDRWLQVSEQRTPGNGTAILHTDITELIQLERQEREKLLDEQARLIRATLDHVDQGICIFDAGLRLVGWNTRLRALLAPPMQLLRVGTGFGALAEHFRRGLVFEDGRPPERLLAWVAREAGRPPLALALETRTGLHLDVFAQEMPDRGFVISFTDVTAEREAKRALEAANESLEQRVLDRTLALEDALAAAERANASKSRFVAAASHDLLQPLSAAKLFLASLESTDVRPEVGVALGRVRSAFESVESILGALLDISRLDSGEDAISLSTIPLDALFARLGVEFRAMARQKRLELRVVPCSLMVRSDATYLRRIVQNLVANAVRYTREGKVLLGARRLPGAVRIEVWDTGPGIPAAERETVFREFQRLAGSESSGGIGLGLTIVERACTLLRHPLELVSVEGRGTGFRVTVPLAAWSESRRESAPAGEPAPISPGTRVALLIENDAAVRTALAALLEAWGVGTLGVASLEEALALLEDLGMAPDVVLADYHLDDGDGLSAIAEIRHRHGPVPAMLVTADRSKGLAARCRGLGVAFLSKPVQPQRLRAWLADPEASMVEDPDAGTIATG